MMLWLPKAQTTAEGRIDIYARLVDKSIKDIRKSR